MSKYRKKPVIVEAFQWRDKTSLKEMPDWLQKAFVEGRAETVFMEGRSVSHIRLQTHGVWMRCNPGDWIIHGVRGELYPRKPDIFEATYESVDDEDTGSSARRDRKCSICGEEDYWLICRNCAKEKS